MENTVERHYGIEYQCLEQCKSGVILTKEYWVETLRLFEKAVEFVQLVQRCLLPSTVSEDIVYLLSEWLEILRASTEVVHSMR